jgi:hypothetical protein
MCSEGSDAQKRAMLFTTGFVCRECLENVNVDHFQRKCMFYLAGLLFAKQPMQHMQLSMS